MPSAAASAHRVLVQVGMELDLVRDQRRGAQGGSLAHQLDVEVADADVARPAARYGLVQRIDLLGQRRLVAGPVQQQQVHVIGAQPRQAFLDRAQQVGRPVVVHPDLGGQEDLLARHAGLGHATTHVGLVAIDLRGVDVAVAQLQRGPGHAGGVLGRHAEHAQAQRGNLAPSRPRGLVGIIRFAPAGISMAAHSARMDH